MELHAIRYPDDKSVIANARPNLSKTLYTFVTTCASTMVSRVGSVRKGRPMRVRVGVFGGTQVGKTKLIETLLNKPFSEFYRPTIEDLYHMDFNIGETNSYNLEFLDTAGAYEFPAMRRLAITTCHIFVLVYAIDDMDSFNQVMDLYQQIVEIRKQVPIILVGNKLDLHQQRKVSRREVDRQTIYWQNVPLEVSAREGVFIEEVMKHLMIFIRAKTPSSQDKPTVWKRVLKKLPILNVFSKAAKK